MPPPGAPPAGAKSALAFFAVLLLLFPAALLAQWASPVAGLVATQLCAFLLPTLAATAGSNLRLAPWLRLERPRPALVALGALAGASGYLVASAAMVATERLVPLRWVEAYDVARLFEGPAWERAALAAVAVALAPVCEEITFRGYIQSTLALRHGARVAIPAGAFLFATLHLDPVRFPALLLLGVAFGWLTWRAGSIWPSIAAHAANNGLAAGLLLGGGPREPGPPPPEALLVPLAVGGVALAAVLVVFRNVAARPPPPPASAVVLRDPASPSLRWRAARVPARLAGATLTGTGALLVLALLGVARGLRR
jgi:membrane protease YdiL (CAAX protease family)